MADGSGAQRALAGLATAGFAIAVAALVTSQLALMSVLDATCAERAAQQIADSRFTADVIERTVQQAVEPVTGAAVAGHLATATSADPRVRAVVETALVGAHRQVVDADAAPTPSLEGNTLVDQAIVRSLIDSATQAGVDLEALGLSAADPASLELGGTAVADAATAAGIPSIVPDDVPDLALRTIAETTRIVALVAALFLGLVAIFAHPRPGRSMRTLGWSVAMVCAVWLVALLVGGWIIGLTTDTLFGEMLDTVWSDAVPSMLLLAGAGVVIGAAAWIAGTSFDGFDRARTQPPPPRR